MYIYAYTAIPFSSGSSQPRDPTRVSRIAGRFFTIWATREVWDICVCISEPLWGTPETNTTLLLN